MPRRTLATLLVMIACAAPARSQFLEGFDGGFNQTWNTFPFASDGDFLGFPGGRFETRAGEQVYRMTNTLSRNDYVGMSPDYVVSYELESVEVRFRILESNGASLSDNMLEMRLVSEGGGFVAVAVAADVWGNGRVRVGNFVTGFTELVLPLQEETWYRLRIADPDFGGALRAHLLADDGTPLVNESLFVNMQEVQTGGLGLYLLLIQRSTGPASLRTFDVALDSAKITLDGCPADMNDDGVLDLADVNLFVAAFTGQTPDADLNGDDLIDLADIALFVDLFTNGCP